MSSNVWFTSDTHFHHRNILEFCRETRRGDCVEEHDELLVEEWNSNVKPKDVVWHTGDFSFGKDDEIAQVIKRLNGRINLVLGNHDGRIRKNPNLVSAFNSVQDIAVFKHGKGPRFVLCHFPMREWWNCHRGWYHLYGHCHGTIPNHHRSMDIGVDARGDNCMSPWALEEVVEKLKDEPYLAHHGEAG